MARQVSHGDEGQAVLDLSNPAQREVWGRDRSRWDLRRRDLRRRDRVSKGRWTLRGWHRGPRTWEELETYAGE